MTTRLAVLLTLLAVSATHALAQSRATDKPGAAPSTSGAGSIPGTAAPTTAPAPPPDYVIGADDVLSIVFWREKDLSADAVVRPDGRISIPLLNDIDVAGLTPEQLRAKLTTEAQRYVQDPTVTVIVKQINSRRVFITGEIAKSGPYQLSGPMTILQLISLAGGLLEYADSKNVLVMRTENGRPMSYRFNYKEVVERKNLKQNIELKPGDVVIVP